MTASVKGDTMATAPGIRVLHFVWGEPSFLAGGDTGSLRTPDSSPNAGFDSWERRSRASIRT
jgi:hypothetical protein